MVIVQERDDAGHLIACFPLLFDQLSSDRITNRLRAIRPAALSAERVKVLHEALFDRDTETDNPGHFVLPPDGS